MTSQHSARYRVPALLGILLTTVLALGAGAFASGASGQLGPAGTIAGRSSAAGDCSSVRSVVAAAVAATTPGATPASVTTARSQAVALARTTASDDVRELVQDLADDLAAYRVTLAHSPSERGPDVGAAIRGDLAGLRRACGA